MYRKSSHPEGAVAPGLHSTAASYLATSPSENCGLLAVGKVRPDERAPAKRDKPIAPTDLC